MKGSIGFQEDRGVYYVSWYHAPHHRTYKIYYYKGIRLETQGLAQKLQALMQGREEQGVFRIEEFTGDALTDVIPYLEEWLESIKGMKPNTYRAYKSRVYNHLIPFFEKHPYQLHEIQYDVLIKLLNSLDLTGKSKYAVMYVLHACLRHAKRSHRILVMPDFPERKRYQIIKRPVEWIESERQEKVIGAIPIEHQPIFWWLKYHTRRPSEACGLHRTDFDGEVFTVRRSGPETDTLKTGDFDQFLIHEDFRPWLEQMKQGPQILSPYFFTNPKARKPGKGYTWDFLYNRWKDACSKIGESIRLYAGMKHSSVSQLINENGLSLSQAQMVTGHAHPDSIKQYANVTLATRKALMEGKVIKMEDRDDTKIHKGNG